MSATENAVTTESFGSQPLPLHERTELVRVQRTYVRCTKCGREERFSWFGARCNEAAELLCLSCGVTTGLRLCRRCRQPRRLVQFGYGQTLPCESSICYGCRVGHQKQPLQVVCSHCNTELTATRSDARFCSGRCRTAAHRATQSERHIQ